MNTARTSKNIHKKKLAEADKPMGWYKAVVFVIVPLSILRVMVSVIFTIKELIELAYPTMFIEIPWFWQKVNTVYLCFFVILVFSLFKLGWHLYIFSRTAAVYLVIVLVMLALAIDPFIAASEPLEELLTLAEFGFAIISAIYFKKRWYMFDNTKNQAEMQRAEEEGKFLERKPMQESTTPLGQKLRRLKEKLEYHGEELNR